LFGVEPILRSGRIAFLDVLLEGAKTEAQPAIPGGYCRVEPVQPLPSPSRDAGLELRQLGLWEIEMKPSRADPKTLLRADRSVRNSDRLLNRNYQGRSWVYTQVSPQSRGLAVGINLSPDGSCDYRCRYCDSSKASAVDAAPVDGCELARELEETLDSIRSGDVSRQSTYRRYPPDCLTWNQVILSGEGEPTLCPNFHEVVETVIHVRARGRYPFFKVVLETNGSGLSRPQVEHGLDLFTPADEVWVKLDAGTGERFRFMSGTDLPLTGLLDRILTVARRRPVVIQSLFCRTDGIPPGRSEISAYLRSLCELRDQGAMIERVQIYSVMTASAESGCSNLPLGSLSEIARQVRGEVGVDAVVF
jgi:hypothetical protein